MGRMKQPDLDAQQAAALDGRHFRALVRISNLADDTLALGESEPGEGDGETCERVPQADLADLLRGGYIVPVTKGDVDGGQE
jgi:hypothetical protein